MVPPVASTRTRDSGYEAVDGDATLSRPFEAIVEALDVFGRVRKKSLRS